MRILGIDPGIARTGWGAIVAQHAACTIQHYGCIETSPELPMHTRLKNLHDQLITIIKKEKPDVLVVEELFFNTNAKTAFVVGQARGIILLTAAEQNLSLAIYTPLQVKVAVTGYGRAEKKQVGQMVKVLLKLPVIPKPDDTADALAIALTHASTHSKLIR